MKKWRYIALFLTICCLSFTLFACDGKDEKRQDAVLPSEQTPSENEEESKMPEAVYLTINEHKICVKLEKNSAVEALVQLLKQGDITYTASDYGGFEKVGSLGHTLPHSDVQMTTQAGDVILYNGDQIVLFYGSNSWRYTKLGKMQGISATELKDILTKSQTVTVKISLD